MGLRLYALRLDGVPDEEPLLLWRENPRLCRGDIQSLTVQGVGLFEATCGSAQGLVHHFMCR